jgi:hypothetical protein
MVSAKCFALNPRQTFERNHEMAKPVKKQIVLNSFSALSFDPIVRQAPVRAVHNPKPTPMHRLARTQDGELPDEARSPVDSTKANRTETTGHFPDRHQRVVNGSDRGAWLTSTSSAR